MLRLDKIDIYKYIYVHRYIYIIQDRYIGSIWHNSMSHTILNCTIIRGDSSILWEYFVIHVIRILWYWWPQRSSSNICASVDMCHIMYYNILCTISWKQYHHMCNIYIYTINIIYIYILSHLYTLEIITKSIVFKEKDWYCTNLSYIFSYFFSLSLYNINDYFIFLYISSEEKIISTIKT